MRIQERLTDIVLRIGRPLDTMLPHRDAIADSVQNGDRVELVVGDTVKHLQIPV